MLNLEAESINILSIDWDYMVDASSEQRYDWFPDGGTEDIPMGVQMEVWASRYSTYPEIAELAPKEEEMLLIEGFIDDHIHEKTRMVIAESHKEIAKYIIEFKNAVKEINLYNIDFHHDCFGKTIRVVDYSFSEEADKIVRHTTMRDCKEIHCGNWLRKLIEYGVVNKATWVQQDDSLESLADEIEIIDKVYCGIEEFIKNESFEIDLIFVCRSALWSPPHLDGDFKLWMHELIQYLNSTEMVEVEENIVLRWTKTFNDAIERNRKEIERLKAQIRGVK